MSATDIFFLMTLFEAIINKPTRKFQVLYKKKIVKTIYKVRIGQI